MQDTHRDQDRTAPAAEDDVLGEAARHTGTLDRLQPGRETRRGVPGDQEDRGEAEPGKDENQAGFVKDADRKFSP